ncbi:phospholipase [Streptomyces sp. MAR4 CNX-425]|uniref:phospholipase n=1 Tax=Streptomyces sp. MAR4 CNX-425 TaxID=3406343 RepID=UPI003B50642A
MAGAAIAGAVTLSVISPAAADSSVAVSASKKEKLKYLGVYTLADNDESRQMYWTALDRFTRLGKNPFKFDWSTDYCSGSPDKPGGFNFKDPCRRHDFGYRNYKKLRAFSEKNKARVDTMFLHDMRRICSVQPGFYSWQRDGCRKTAQKYYSAVRVVGYL